MSILFDIAITVFLIISGVFGLVGSYGLIKLPDPMSRLHAPTKATTLGVGGVLIASMLHAIAVEGQVSLHELLITLFLLITAPITANFIAKAHLHRHVEREQLPDAAPDDCWAVHDIEPFEAGTEPASDTVK